MPKAKRAEPKFKIGDVVKEKERPDVLLGTQASQVATAKYGKPRTRGTILSIKIKRDKRGFRQFFYDVFWETNKLTSEHHQMRLEVIEE